jgi:hypothetical protein
LLESAVIWMMLPWDEPAWAEARAKAAAMAAEATVEREPAYGPAARGRAKLRLARREDGSVSVEGGEPWLALLLDPAGDARFERRLLRAPRPPAPPPKAGPPGRAGTLGELKCGRASGPLASETWILELRPRAPGELRRLTLFLDPETLTPRHLEAETAAGRVRMSFTRWTVTPCSP